MTRPTDLSALVERLASAQQPDGPVLESDGPMAILQEISECMLPAHLICRNEAGQVLIALAANRRLCALVDAPPTGQAALPVGVPLEEDPETVASIAMGLSTFCGGAARVAVSSALLAEADPSFQTGISPCVLQRHLEQHLAQHLAQHGEPPLAEPAAPPEQDPTERLADFLAPVIDRSKDWIMIQNDEVVGHSGDQPSADLLRSTAHLRPLCDAGPEGSGPNLLVRGSRAGRRSHVFAWSDDWMFGATGVLSPGEPLTQTWRRLGL